LLKFLKFDNLKRELRKGNFKLIFACGISLILVGIFFIVLIYQLLLN
jgi:hypothetical protein